MYEITFLDNNPVNESSFEGHTLIANALNDALREQGQGRAIALMGRWGSGKTTVLNLLKKLLDKNPNIFEYDAWVHDRTQLQKAFILEFIDFFSPRLKEKSATDLKETILGILQKTDSHEISKTPRLLALGGILYAITLATAIKLFSEKIYLPDLALGLKNIVFDKIQTIYWFLTLLLSGWPVFVPRLNKYLFYKAAELKDESLLKIERITPMQTRFEFKEHFNFIYKDISPTRNEPLIIILDNLDRIPTHDALDLINCVKDLIDLKASKDLWLIIPMQEDTFQNTYEQDDQKNLITTDLLAKLFDIRFDLKTPLLIDIDHFFKENLCKVFGNSLPKKTEQQIYKLFEAENLDHEISTPRFIKSILNDLASLYLVHKESIPLATLFLFRLKRDLIKKDISAFLKPLNNGQASSMSAEQERLLENSEWRTDFAAIYYGVDGNRALHLVLKDQLITGFSDGDTSGEFLHLTSTENFQHIIYKDIRENGRYKCQNGKTWANMVISLDAIEKNIGYSLPDSRAENFSKSSDPISIAKSFKVFNQACILILSFG